MKSSLSLSALFFNLLIFVTIIPFTESYKTLMIILIIFIFLVLDLKSTMDFIKLLPYTDINPYIYGLLIIHPYTHVILLYILSGNDIRSLIKSIFTLTTYNGVWLDKLIRSKEYNLEET